MAIANTIIPNREIVNLQGAGKSIDEIVHPEGTWVRFEPERVWKPAECRLAESGAGR
jgi:hypothetical protein